MAERARSLPPSPMTEPEPSPRGPGRVILLNGASSSGKSTLARGLQEVESVLAAWRERGPARALATGQRWRR